MNESIESRLLAQIAEREKSLTEERLRIDGLLSNIRQLESAVDGCRKSIAWSAAWLAETKKLMADRERLMKVTKGGVK